jgi:hypothetical protein
MANLQTIYRVENKAGQGPYTDCGSQCWSDRSHFDSKHPSPHREGLNMSDELVCGFESITKLNQWFDQSELECMLLEYAFTVVRFIVNPEAVELQSGEYQCIFNRSKAQSFETINLK